MIIEGENILFKSMPPLYEKERSGKKKNTVRKLVSNEERELRDNVKKLKSITIWNLETHEGFKRTLTDVTEYDGFWIFSWK